LGFEVEEAAKVIFSFSSVKVACHLFFAPLWPSNLSCHF
jgi:hypothetical protein